MSERYPRETCYICDFDTAELLQKHHIVPQRYGGGEGENVVHLCPSCHQAVESLYDKRFYSRLGVEQGNDVKTAFRVAEAARDFMLDKLNEIPQRHRIGLFEIGDHTDSIAYAMLHELGLEAAVCDGCYRNGPYEDSGEGQVRCLRCSTLQNAGPGQQMGVGDDV